MNFWKIRYILFFLLLSVFNFPCSAQIVVHGKLANEYAKLPKPEYLDKSIAECIYEYTVKDPVLERIETHNDILQMGAMMSKYFSYFLFCSDSIVSKLNRKEITYKDLTEIWNRCRRKNKGSSSIIVKHYPEKTISYHDRIFMDNYVYADSVVFDWRLTTDTLSVCGYLCKKAETRFRGRNWTAYYAEDIPVSDGPWKFSGLPGLILRIEDAKKEHVFSAIVIRRANEDICLSKTNSFKTSRERFNKQIKEYKNDPGKIISGSQLVPKDPQTGKAVKIPPRRLFFNPVELE